MEKAVMILDIDQILASLEQIRDSFPILAQELENLANDFEYEQMLAFIKQQTQSRRLASETR